MTRPGDIPTLQFPVRIEPPDLAPWRAGNAGIPGFVTLESGRPGPHLGAVSLIHGNEFSGAIVLDRFLRQGQAPRVGRLTLCFANLGAFDRFDPAHPTASRFIEEDLNRLWDPALLDGPGQSIERHRAREMRPGIESFDLLLDLHSMLWPSVPLLLSGRSERGRALARLIGAPSLVVADHGHDAGRRLIDYPHFVRPDGDRAACLIEAGPHWEPQTVALADRAFRALLVSLGMMAEQPAPAASQRHAQVTKVVTAATSAFSFARSVRGGDIVPRAGTIIARDGEREILTPYDDCLLVMPSLRPGRGHTAVRLARFLDNADA